MTTTSEARVALSTLYNAVDGESKDNAYATLSAFIHDVAAIPFNVIEVKVTPEQYETLMSKGSGSMSIHGEMSYVPNS